MISNLANTWNASKIPSLIGRIAVVTGGNEGVGASFCTELLKNDISKLFITSNDAARHAGALSHFSKEVGHDVSKKVIFYEMDLGDYSAVKRVTEKIKQETDRIDILNCNAAIGMYKTDVPPTTTNKSHALDRHFACNNVGHAILLQGLLPTMKKTAAETGDARIVIMASNLHFSASADVKFSSIDELNTDLGPTLQYNRSKLANVLYTKKLARMFHSEQQKKSTDQGAAEAAHDQNLFINCVHPGVVKTAQQDGVLETYSEKIEKEVGSGVVGTGMASTLKGLNYAARAVGMKDSPEGALSALYAATSPDVKEKGLNGEYIVPNGTIQEADKRSLDEKFQDRCFDLIQECIEKNLGNDEGADHQEGSIARGSSTI